MSKTSFGIDVSRWQGAFDWVRAKKEGVEFGIIKCGGGDDGLYKDSQFERNCKESDKAGIRIGAYFFGNANTAQEAKREAEYCLSIIKGHRFSYPIYYDVEAARMNVGKDALDNIISTFCDTVKNAGYVAGFYMNYNWYKNYCNGEQLAKKYELWIASWSKSCPVGGVKMWQFGGSTNQLRSTQICGMTVDQNYCYNDYPTEIRSAGLNGFESEKDKTTIRAGVGVRILPGAKYPSGEEIPVEIRKKWWYVKYVSNGKACLDWSVDGTLRLFTEIPIKYLERYPE